MLRAFTCCFGARVKHDEERLPLALPSETTHLVPRSPGQTPPLSPRQGSPHPRELTSEERAQLDSIAERISNNMQPIYHERSSSGSDRGRTRTRGVSAFTPLSASASRSTSRRSSIASNMEALEREAEGYGELVQVTRVKLGLARGRSRGVKSRGSASALAVVTP